jgi:hypothetical protein
MQSFWIRYTVKWIDIVEDSRWRLSEGKIDLQFIPRSINTAQFLASNYKGHLECVFNKIRVQNIAYEIAAKLDKEVHLAEFKHTFVKPMFINGSGLTRCRFEFVSLNILLETDSFPDLKGVQFIG